MKRSSRKKQLAKWSKLGLSLAAVTVLGGLVELMDVPPLSNSTVEAQELTNQSGGEQALPADTATVTIELENTGVVELVGASYRYQRIRGFERLEIHLQPGETYTLPTYDGHKLINFKNFNEVTDITPEEATISYADFTPGQRVRLYYDYLMTKQVYDVVTKQYVDRETAIPSTTPSINSSTSTPTAQPAETSVEQSGPTEKPVETPSETSATSPAETPTNVQPSTDPAGQSASEKQETKEQESSKLTSQYTYKDITGTSSSVNVRVHGQDVGKVASLSVKKENDPVVIAKLPQALAEQQVDLYDIKTLDATGQFVQVTEDALITLPVAAGKEVDKVIYFLASTGAVEELPFTVDKATNQVSFVVSHFSHYGIVYQANKPVSQAQSGSTGQSAQGKQATKQGDKEQAPSASSSQKEEVKPAPTSQPQAKTLPATGEASSVLHLTGLGLLGLAGLVVKRRQRKSF
ncbi:LPXTG cell wall anchor domain-containing protein [Streptococcus suis]|uniref:LPXTG cell wall anchor domain-containing protein n=1 Tax=Streptococcus suis TaxID=1307 RepID=UPI0021184297|nr:LPXTG cell wall anchor domain-containing protein [Streptococcus suis]MCQ8263639.1 LPXTG cell wall anchor domain-containing protein [Streptococcus suis]